MAEAQAGETPKLGALVAQARTGQRTRWVMLLARDWSPRRTSR